VDENNQTLSRNLQMIERFMTPGGHCALKAMLPSIPKALIRKAFAGENDKDLRIHTDRGYVKLNNPDKGAALAATILHQLEQQGKINYHGLIVVLGFSGTALVRAIADKLEQEGKIFVLTPHPEIFASLLSFCDFSVFGNVSSGRLQFGVSEDLVENIEFMRDFFSSCLIKQFSLVVTPELFRLYAQDCRNAVTAINEMLAHEKRNMITSMVFSRNWYENAMNNFLFRLEEPPLPVLKNSFPDKTAIVVGAGPGLKYMLDFIKENQTNYIIICVGTALGALVENGITPDFVIVVDGSPKIRLQFDVDIPKESFLVCSPAIVSEITGKFVGRSFVFETDQLNGLRLWLKGNGFKNDRLKTSGTVAVSGVALAFYIGCSYIVLAGVDLCFPPDGCSHVGGTMYGNGKIKEPLVSVRGNWDREVQTTEQFADYIWRMKNYIHQIHDLNPDLKIINTSPGGALISGAEPVLPEKLIEFSLPQMKINKYAYILGLRQGIDPTSDIMRLIPALKSLCKEFADIIAGSSKIAFSAQSLDMLSSENVKLLDEVDARLNNNRLAAMIIDGVTRCLYMELSNCDPNDRLAFADKSRKLYRTIHETSVYTVSKLEIIIQEIEKKYQLGEESG